MKYKIQEGVSLIELMVSLVLSSFLILAITHIYLKNKQSYIFEMATAEMQDSADFAQMTFENWLYKAGYRRGMDVPLEKAFPQKKYEADGYSCDFPTGFVATKLSGKNGVCIRYQPVSEEEIDCAGNVVKFSDTQDKVFVSSDPDYLVVLAIEHEKVAGKNDGKVYCKNLNSSATGLEKVELLDRVADMAIEFGYSSTKADEFHKKIDTFSSVKSWSNGQKVYSIRYGLLLSSAEKKAQSKSSGVLGYWKQLTGSDDAVKQDNNQLYKIVSATLVLKGITP